MIEGQGAGVRGAGGGARGPGKASMAHEMLERVRDDGLLAPARRVVVLFSGGRDSTCLLDLAVRVAGPGAVTALHVNYGLRAEAAAEERHCERLARRLGVGLEVRRAHRRASGNLQAWARQERYREAGELAEALGADVAAGHTATDQVETILYRLASSPSRRALLGMRPREGRLVRPLLAFTREQTARYCTERELAWCEDATNTSDAYARGRVRARLVPALEAIHPAASQNVVALAETLRDEAEVLDALVDGVLAGRPEIELAQLRALAPALQRLVVQRLADQAAGRPAPGTARRVAELLGMGDNALLDLPHGVRAATQGGILRFMPRTAGGGPPQTATPPINR
jgi:tRNA(Ile)-lysidine synthase